MGAFFSRRNWNVAALGLAAFALLAARFSPNWVALWREVQAARGSVPGVVIERAVLSGPSERGIHVVRLAHDLHAEIENPIHKIARWRLLFPVIGYVLRLADWQLLGLAQLGCVVLAIALVGLGARTGVMGSGAMAEAFCLALIAGSSAPFFTSMGWLGYYDSWLALAFLAVAFARQRWLVLAACVLAPWIDERFVLGLPLALVVRRLAPDHAAEPPAKWLREEALLPMVLCIGYVIVRFSLGGSGGSQTMAEYAGQFIYGFDVATGQRALGAWTGLRFGWCFVAFALFARPITEGPMRRLQTWVLGTGVVLTSLAGLYMAYDLSRAMVLLMPVVVLGWIHATRAAWWQRLHANRGLAAAALLVPAQTIVGNSSTAVDSFWPSTLPVVAFETNVGLMYARGEGVAKDSRTAVRWFRRAAERNYDVAQNNLGLMYASGEGVEKDPAEAARWFRRAAEQNNAEGERNLAALYAGGTGVPRDDAQAFGWMRRAAEHGSVEAQVMVGLMYTRGIGVHPDPVAAFTWYRRAAESGNAEAQNSLGAKFTTGTGAERDLVQAFAWFTLAAARGNRDAGKNLGQLQAQMSPAQLAAAQELSAALGRKIERRK